MAEAKFRKNQNVPEGCLSVPQIAEQLKCTIVNVHVHINRGHLKAFRNGKRIYVPQEALEAFIANRRRPGRPFKSQMNPTTSPSLEAVEMASAEVVEENACASL